jgi:hypothetical protein
MTSGTPRAVRPAGWARGRLSAWRALPGHARTMIVASLADSLGAGLYLTGSSVYFVRSVGLSADQVAVGQAVTAALGLAAGIPAGKLADRLGPRNVTAALVMLSIPGLAALAQVRSFWTFLPATAAVGVPMMAAEVARGALMAQVAGQAAAPKLAIWTRTAFNAGFSAGLLGAGVVIAVGSRPAYVSLFTAEAVSNALTCLLLLRLPRAGSRHAAPRGEHAAAALRDLPYMLVAQLSGLTRLGDTILTLGLPLWIVTHTAAPRELAAWLLVGNTILVVALQVRVTRRATSIAGAAQIQQWAFAALALACVIVSPSARLGAAGATGMLLATTALLTFGEMWGEGAWWSLRYGLGPPAAQGAYGAAFALGQAAPSVLGPMLVTALAIDLGAGGWLILAGIFLGCAAPGRWLVAWAVRQRLTASPAMPPATPSVGTPAPARRQSAS